MKFATTWTFKPFVEHFEFFEGNLRYIPSDLKIPNICLRVVGAFLFFIFQCSLRFGIHIHDGLMLHIILLQLCIFLFDIFFTAAVDIVCDTRVSDISHCVSFESMMGCSSQDCILRFFETVVSLVSSMFSLVL